VTAREQAAVEEVERLSERLALVNGVVTDYINAAQTEMELSDSLAENVASLLLALTDAGVTLHVGRVGPFEDGPEEWAWWAEGIRGDDDVREAVADAIRGCQAALNAHAAQREGGAA